MRRRAARAGAGARRGRRLNLSLFVLTALSTLAAGAILPVDSRPSIGALDLAGGVAARRGARSR